MWTVTTPTITYSNRGMQERPYADTFIRFEMEFPEPVDAETALAAAHQETTFNDKALGTWEDMMQYRLFELRPSTTTRDDGTSHFWQVALKRTYND